MELVNEFVVNKAIDDTWPILTDLERIAPCMPGAQLTEVEGDIYRGFVKIKVGPIGAQFKGQAQFADRDDSNHRATLKADGRDTKGNGNASALITAQLESLTPTSTRCKVTTDLNITGKVAQFGRGVLPDISTKLINQFADNLNAMISEPAAASAVSPAAPIVEPAEPAAAAEPKPAVVASAPADEPSTTPDTSDGQTAAAKDPSRPTVRKINSEPVEPLKVASILPHWVKTALPGGLLALLLFFLLRRKH